MSFLKKLKRLPIDLGQGNLRKTTKGKLIALGLIKNGKGKRALDVGCREGVQSRWLESKGYKVTAIDISPKYRKGIKVNVEKKLPFKSNSFDLIWCSEVIEHLKDPQFTVSEFWRILKKEGEIIITTPNSGMWIYSIARLFGKSPRDMQRRDHKQYFKINDIKKLLPNAEIYGFFPYCLLKFRIKHCIGFLSPTFVARSKKKQQTAS